MKTYFITGATGLIGGSLVRSLAETQEYIEGHCSVIVLVRDTMRFQTIFHDIDCRNIRLIEGDLCDVSLSVLIPEKLDYIIHCAVPTASAYMISHPVETADSIVLGTRNVLELARQKRVKSMVYLSSMEVYGKVPDIGRCRKEDELGEIALDNVRSCYPLAKRMAEHYCYTYAKEYGVPVKVARLAQTFGKGVRSEDRRVYMQFAKAVVEQADIVLKTRGESIGNYCATEDAISAIHLLLHKGEAGEVYNVVNEANTMRIFEMAHLVAEEVAGGVVEVVYDLEEYAKTGYAPETHLRMSGKKLRGLGWQPTKELVDMYKDVIDIIQNEIVQ